MVDSAFREVLQAYLASNHRKKVEIIERAYRFAKEAHKGVRRRSGEPYILHPIAVAKIVISELGLGSTSICAALLHDVVEDTEYTREDIEAAFGAKIADIVEGLTKISGGILGAQSSVQAENFRKLLLSMSADIRVILIKMADRLHNMRTLGSMRPEKQYKIAGETLYVYAPLAHRLGLFKIKMELEDLAFKYEHPQKYAWIMERLKETSDKREKIVEEFVRPVREKLDAAGFKYEIKARVKSAYSIFNKMETKKVPFEEIYDLYAVRVIFENDDDAMEKIKCWQIYTFFTDGHVVHPDRLRDWTSIPKANGYRALHLTAMGPEGKWIEVQIRSRKMDDIAELGYAAHWKYKTGVHEEETELDSWMNTIKDILANPEPNAIDFLETIKLNLLSSEIYVFTPKGDLITLPAGSTVLDLAFAIHSEVGLHCMAGKINHKLVPLAHVLESGDQAEIITSASQTPKQEWLQACHTARAQNKIRGALRKAMRQQQAEGQAENAAKAASPAAEPAPKRSLMQKLLRNPFSSKRRNEEPTREPVDRSKVFILHPDARHPNYRTDSCCSPIPGDDVLGFVDDDENVVLHKVHCDKAMMLKTTFGSRLVATAWGETPEKFLVSISIDGLDRQGILEEITNTISQKLGMNIRGLSIEAQDEVFHCDLTLQVDSAETVETVCDALKKIKDVKFAQRTS
jgi:GTP pyrophosphokinase